MGGAQPLAVTMNGGVAICIDCDPSRIDRRIEHGYLDVQADDVDDALRLAAEAAATRAGRCPSACSATPPTSCRSCSPMGAPIDIVTDQTSAHDPLTLPAARASAFEDMAALRAEDPAGFTQRARESMAEHVRGDGRLPGRRRRGLRLRQLDPRRGRARRVRAGVRLPRLRARLHPAAVLRGQGPVPLGGAVRRPGGHRGHRPGHPRPVPARTSRWPAGSGWPARRSTSRACPPGSAGSATASGTWPGERFNELVADGDVQAPIVIGRDHLDCGSVASPYRETEAMADGSRRDRRLAAAERPGQHGLRRLLGHHPPRRRRRHRPLHPRRPGLRRRRHRRWPAQKLERVLTNDPGMGVIRHVDAGYDRAAEVAAERGVRVPMREPVVPSGTSVRRRSPSCGSALLPRRPGRGDRRLPPLRLDRGGRGLPRLVRRRRGRAAACARDCDRNGNLWAWWGRPGRGAGRRRRHRQPPGLGAGRRRVRRAARRRLRVRRDRPAARARLRARAGRSASPPSPRRRAPGSASPAWVAGC